VNPLALAGLFGFVKGLLASHQPTASGPHWLHSVVAAPIYEEAIFRMVPLQFSGNNLPVGWTGVPFALEHVIQESKHGMSTSRMFARFTEVAFGGMLYELAYRKWGLLGAAASHSGHNFGVKLGNRIARKWLK